MRMDTKPLPTNQARPLMYVPIIKKYIHVNISLAVCEYVCMYVRTYVRMYVCMYVCMCVCVCMYVNNKVENEEAQLQQKIDKHCPNHPMTIQKTAQRIYMQGSKRALQP